MSSEIAIYLEREIPNTGRELDQNNDLLPTNLTTFYVQPNHERLYEPLREGSVVRLLGLEPGKFEDQLRLHFYHVDLAIFCPEYEALSYVWGGSGSGVSSINLAYVSGHQLVISENLNGALRGLRSELKLRIVWVDAICINQNDVGERGHQVSLMSTIYGQARCVVVWLGEPEYGRSRSLSDRGERMFTTVCHIVNDWLGKNHQGRTATFDVVSNSGGRRTVQPPSTGWCYNSDKGESSCAPVVAYLTASRLRCKYQVVSTILGGNLRSLQLHMVLASLGFPGNCPRTFCNDEIWPCRDRLALGRTRCRDLTNETPHHLREQADWRCLQRVSDVSYITPK